MEEYLGAFRDEVIARAADVFGGRDREAGFGSVAGQMLEEAEELIDFVPCPYRGFGARRRSLGIDGYAFDEADGSLRIVIAEFGGEKQPFTLTQTIAKAIFSKPVSFVEEAFARNDDHLSADDHPASDFFSLLQTHKPSITRLRFYLATDGILSDRIRDWPEQSVDGIPAEFHIWDIVRFHDVLSSRSGREALTVDFGGLVEGGIPCLKASLNQSEYSGYLCVLPGETLARMYEEYGSRLLEGNVRSFLGKAVRVNKAIRETILRSPEMFFAFNNGIAATATSVETQDTPGGPRLLAATDLQIVNGGQTTASLALARRKDGADLNGIFVQMKLSVVDTDRSADLIPKISEYANRQTKVSDSDLFSNHAFHRKMEELSRRIKAPPRPGSQRPTTWFYERAKGQYRIETSKMSPAEKLRFESDNPRRQVITKTDLAKIENSWRQLPHEVSKGAQKNFDVYSKFVVEEWQRRPLQFNDEFFKSSVGHTIVFRELEQLIPAETDWYDGGYRANIVTFTIAKLAQMIAEQGAGNALNVQSIWRTQAISPALSAQLKVIARAMYSVITAPEQGLENVTEWCKKELAWQRAHQQRISLISEFAAELVPEADELQRKEDAIGVARIDSDIAAITEVMNYKASNWRKLRDWGIQSNELTPKEDQLLMLAGSAGRIPTSRQAFAILQIRQRLELAGFQIGL
ncbi:AIPR family protein [Casimicrobium huifangae]|uniref:AIPR family protein n=1 Tax=Casimicrobium huifangae TaxID=2591109 RepID=UPI0012EC5E14|nr:AIPR family protein [Casimicrobium huifangae]